MIPFQLYLSNHNFMKMKIVLFVFALFLANNSYGQDIPVKFKIDNLRNSKGSIIVSIYKNAKSFDEGIPASHKYIPKNENMNEGIFEAKISLPPGVYGLVFTDDEDNNGKMTNRVIGLPKEGFGFSNFYLSGLKKPKFSNFSFMLKKDMETMQLRLRYM